MPILLDIAIVSVIATVSVIEVRVIGLRLVRFTYNLGTVYI